MKIKLIVVCMAMNFLSAYSQTQRTGPAYKFDLFKNTPNWELAKAVEIEDTIEIIKLIKSHKLDINLKEPKFGNTLLYLSVANDKYFSTKVLLENKADINVSNSFGTYPIVEATKFIRFKKNAPKILKLLIEHGANVNSRSTKINGKDTLDYYSPLVNATTNLECTKILLKNGADPYVKYGNIFPVWSMLLLNIFGDNIYVAKYLIIEKKMSIPNPISYSIPKKDPLDIYYFLNLENFRGDTSKEKAKQDILNYLHKIDFPNNQVYKK